MNELDKVYDEVINIEKGKSYIVLCKKSEFVDEKFDLITIDYISDRFIQLHSEKYTDYKSYMILTIENFKKRYEVQEEVK